VEHGRDVNRAPSGVAAQRPGRRPDIEIQGVRSYPNVSPPPAVDREPVTAAGNGKTQHQARSRRASAVVAWPLFFFLSLPNQKTKILSSEIGPFFVLGNSTVNATVAICCRKSALLRDHCWVRGRCIIQADSSSSQPLGEEGVEQKRCALLVALDVAFVGEQPLERLL